MSTRSLTVFKDGENQDIAVMYRQCDGYPEGHGKELADFLKNKKIVNGINSNDDENMIFNGAGCLAAQVVSHFKDGVGGIYLYPPTTKDCGQSYTYFVSGKIGEEPSIEVGDFKGKASEFQKWLDN